jgi:hypothetical protein
MMTEFKNALHSSGDAITSFWYHSKEKPCHVACRPELNEYSTSTNKGRKRKADNNPVDHVREGGTGRHEFSCCGASLAQHPSRSPENCNPYSFRLLESMHNGLSPARSNRGYKPWVGIEHLLLFAWFTHRNKKNKARCENRNRH